jgi:hypothetical protein
MSAPSPLEVQILRNAELVLAAATAKFVEPSSYELRMQILECAAARLGGFPASSYFDTFGISRSLEFGELDEHAKRLLEVLNSLPVHPALALSSLSRKPLSVHAQRESGAYYTDFRLANHVAEQGKRIWLRNRPIVDPACGAGILLTAVTVANCGADRNKVAEFLATNVIAADASADALRGACLALASLTNDLDAIVRMRSRWFLGDSLLRTESEWGHVAPEGFGLVIANPPWEKVKVTRHEFVKASGKKRHYGEAHSASELAGLDFERGKAGAYAKELARRYPLAANGEIDLYIAFVELFFQLAKNGGGISALVPAGLIRSEGTAGLREELLASSNNLEITIFENRSRFFSIDTRFKFLGLLTRTNFGTNRTGARNLKLAHASGTDTAVVVSSQANISCNLLRKLRADLTVPEVRTSAEWALFSKMAASGVQWHENLSPWAPNFCREVDMTKEKPKFQARPGKGSLALIEGRMVHQHRYGAKRYVSGTGRKALWIALPVGGSIVSPQHWIRTQDVPVKAQERAFQLRAGFCDITGQTNERSMMAALIPPGVVCGNKVPTVLFNDDADERRLRLWVGMVNSLPFDWLMRRLVTTTVNYFLLRGVPLPNIEIDGLPGKEVIKAINELRTLDVDGSSKKCAWRTAELRARIDIISLIGYGAGYDDLTLMLQDFPLMDRAQPPLTGEVRSTVTRDYLLLAAARRFNRPTADLATRIQAAIKLGAIPYVPSQSDVIDEEQDESKTG